MQHLTPNSTLQNDKYRITEVLGQGSFGITYRAHHEFLDRTVAIKEFFMKELNSRSEDGSITGLSDGSLSYNYAQKFRKEAQNLARLQHPNIVSVTDCFDENGTFYYVMDYIDGQNLNEYIKNRALSQDEAVAIIKEVAKALQYMHEEKHMLHLDLKPGNIMRRASDGHIFLIDFGLSKHYNTNGEPETSTTIGLGTAGYAPVEQGNQAKSGEFRPTIDVYALGATLFKLLTGETPPAASELISDDDLIAVHLKAHGVSEALVLAVVNAMLPNVKKRTQTIDVFEEAISSKEDVKTSNETAKGRRNNSKTNTEDTLYIKATVVKHPDFDESKYVIAPNYLNYLTHTSNLANQGDIEAMLAYGMMALRGEGMGQNLFEAYNMFRKLKSRGDDRGEKLISQWTTLRDKYKKSTLQVPANVNTSSTTSPEGCSSSISWMLIILLMLIPVISIAIIQCQGSKTEGIDISGDSTWTDYDSIGVDTAACWVDTVAVACDTTIWY